MGDDVGQTSTRSRTQEPALAQLEFPLPGARKPLNRGRIYFVLAVMMMAGASGTIVILVASLLRPDATSNPWVIVGSIVLSALVFPFAYILSTVRDFSVRDGVMTLRLPVRLASGTKTRRIALAAVDHAEPFVWSDGDSGLLVLLKDRTQIRIWKSDLPEGSDQFLASFLAVYGQTNRAKRNQT